MEAWKNLSNPNWKGETEASLKSCHIKNYNYEKVLNTYLIDKGKRPLKNVTIFVKFQFAGPKVS